MRATLLLTILVAAAVLFGVGCRWSNEPQETLPFPIQLRSTTPGDSVTVIQLPMNFSAAFNQEIQVDDVLARSIPLPETLGTASAHGKTLNLSGLVPSPSSLAHWMVLDGPDFLRPYVVRFFTGDARGDFFFPDPETHPCLVSGELGQVGTIAGDLYTSRDGAPSLENALVFAYEKTSMGSDPKLVDLLEATPIAVTRASGQGVPVGSVESTAFTVTNLIIDLEYALLVILDTNGDGRYEIEHDWWGYSHDFTTGALIFRRAHVDQCTPILNVEMRPPLGSSPAP